MHSGKFSFQIATSADLKPGVFVSRSFALVTVTSQPHPISSFTGKNTTGYSLFPALFQEKNIRAFTHDCLAGHTCPSSTPKAAKFHKLTRGNKMY
jgi:hypothetical protein